MSFVLPTGDLETGTARVRDLIRDVPDFPRPGVLFRDITPVLASRQGLSTALALQLHAVADLAGAVDVVAGIESRGFLFGMAMAERLGVGFVPVRKPGKLPAQTVEQRYSLEYGEDALQIHADAISNRQRVLVVDDLLATGGTAAATAALLEGLGATIAACVFLIELEFLRGRGRLEGQRVESVIRY